MPQSESLQAGLVIAGFDALRLIGGEALVQILLVHAGEVGLDNQASSATRIPIEQYLHYRDAALDFLGDSFLSTAFETGKNLVRKLQKDRPPEMLWLLDQYKHAASQLPLIGQAAVLAAKGNPGSVTAKMKSNDALLIVIERCPECRGAETGDAVLHHQSGGHLRVRAALSQLAGDYEGDALYGHGRPAV